MALHPDFPDSPHAILDPEIRWFPADEALRENSADKLMPPLVHQLRRKVKEFRDSGYVGATDTSRSLLNWWFKEPHLLTQANGNMAAFQYFFAQREALETIIYLYDVVGAKDKFDLMRFDSSGAVSAQMFDESWRRYVVKMATGSGKTKVMSLALAWSFYHKLYEPDSELARNFLVIAPNIIVLDRIYKDFEGLRIFFEDPVVPDNGFDGHNWRDDFQLTLHLQDEVRVTRPTGNIFLTNIHRVYSGNEIPPSPDDDNGMDYFLGKRPTGATTDSNVDLGEIVRDIDELMVLNDEAHHIHDAKLAWFKSIEDIHNRLLQKGDALSLQLDVTATPKHNNGAIFVQTISDYPKWTRPWSTSVGAPSNYLTGARYKGVNTLLLGLSAHECGYDMPVWATFKQWRLKGGKVRKGEHRPQRPARPERGHGRPLWQRGLRHGGAGGRAGCVLPGYPAQSSLRAPC
jgi:type III restriction enzyme